LQNAPIFQLGTQTSRLLAAALRGLGIVPKIWFSNLLIEV
jgi:hypothetical protein